MAGLGDIFGGAKSSPESEPPMMPEEGDSELPPGFEEAYAEYAETPSAASMYRLIEACKGDGGGLDILIGKPKGK
jgi:hypothetical protein